VGEGGTHRGRRRIVIACLLFFMLAGSLWVMAFPPLGGLSQHIGARQWTALGGVEARGYQLVKQHSLWDCGYAALATILEPAEVGAAMFDSLTVSAPPPPGGVTVGALEALGAKYGMPLVGRSVVDESWLGEQPPYIILLAEHHFVAVVHRDHHGAVVADPGAGVFAVSLDSLVTLRPLAVLTRQ
jgi:hypothetical protein